MSLSEIVSVPGEGEAPGEAAMVFRGLVSTDNSGGFASVRCRNFEPALDLGAYEGIEMRLKVGEGEEGGGNFGLNSTLTRFLSISLNSLSHTHTLSHLFSHLSVSLALASSPAQGDGQRYKLILRTDPGWDSIAYCFSFDTAPDQWQDIRVPFSAFFPVFRAKTLKVIGTPKPPPLLCSSSFLSRHFRQPPPSSLPLLCSPLRLLPPACAHLSFPFFLPLGLLLMTGRPWSGPQQDLLGAAHALEVRVSEE